MFRLVPAGPRHCVLRRRHRRLPRRAAGPTSGSSAAGFRTGPRTLTVGGRECYLRAVLPQSDPIDFNGDPPPSELCDDAPEQNASHSVAREARRSKGRERMLPDLKPESGGTPADCQRWDGSGKENAQNVSFRDEGFRRSGREKDQKLIDQGQDFGNGAASVKPFCPQAGARLDAASLLFSAAMLFAPSREITLGSCFGPWSALRPPT